MKRRMVAIVEEKLAEVMWVSDRTKLESSSQNLKNACGEITVVYVFT